jgi:hypothetical protein
MVHVEVFVLRVVFLLSMILLDQAVQFLKVLALRDQRAQVNFRYKCKLVITIPSDERY